MRSKSYLYLLLLLITIVIVAAFSMVLGEFDISILEFPEILRSGSGIEYAVLTKIRIPRIILGIAVGGALGLSGVILQGVYRNPLVEPYTLGISGGASVGVTIAIVFGLQHLIGDEVLPIFGLLGSLISTVAVYIISIRSGSVNVNKMLLIGVMISFVSSSVVMFLMSITSSDNLSAIIFWTMGSLDEPNQNLIYLLLAISIVGLLLSYLYARPLNALRLGKERARELGIDSDKTIKILFIICALLTGVAVSVVGIIGFVGLIIPQLARAIVGTDYRILLITSFLGGALFILISDMVARTVISPIELPIGVITGIVGGVIFIAVLLKNGKKI